MNDGQRIEWVKVARATLGSLPVDLLSEGCIEARKHADHPAKIVPIIMRLTDDAMRARRNMAGPDRVPRERHIEPQYVKPEEARAILEKHGLPVPAILRSTITGVEQ